ncbi:nuclear transport factor 2 family protein [Haliea sp. E17]|uniref:nuclear transport factor 2 family protein n=1 Tax=Haliea sp. E17 TaxID=3401576 RepID=UPI003AADFEB3
MRKQTAYLCRLASCIALLSLLPQTLAAETVAENNRETTMTDTVELTRAWLEHFPEGNFDAFPGAIAEDFLLRLPFMPAGVPTDYRGRETAQAVLKGSAEGRSPLVFSEVRILRTEDPELVMTTARGQATMNSGKLYENEYIMLTRIRDGVVLEHIEYLNPLAVIASMGSD